MSTTAPIIQNTQVNFSVFNEAGGSAVSYDKPKTVFTAPPVKQPPSNYDLNSEFNNQNNLTGFNLTNMNNTNTSMNQNNLSSRNQTFNSTLSFGQTIPQPQINNNNNMFSGMNNKQGHNSTNDSMGGLMDLGLGGFGSTNQQTKANNFDIFDMSGNDDNIMTGMNKLDLNTGFNNTSTNNQNTMQNSNFAGMNQNNSNQQSSWGLNNLSTNSNMGMTNNNNMFSGMNTNQSNNQSNFSMNAGNSLMDLGLGNSQAQNQSMNYGMNQNNNNLNMNMNMGGNQNNMFNGMNTRNNNQSSNVQNNSGGFSNFDLL